VEPPLATAPIESAFAEAGWRAKAAPHQTALSATQGFTARLYKTTASPIIDQIPFPETCGKILKIFP
jgi:hypothetical protein